MKKLLWLVAVVTVLGAVSSFANIQRQNYSELVGNGAGVQAAEPDSSVSVIAWFSKCDTVTYWVNESEWKISGDDTVRTMSVSMKVMINVTDSTAEGYDMEYHFLEFACDSLASQGLGQIQNAIVAMLGDKITGTTIKFHTDELGRIERYDNLDDIKAQAEGLVGQLCEAYGQSPEIEKLKSSGLDLASLLREMLTDERVIQGYVEEIELLFQCHGSEFALGQNSIHSDETETEYASDTELLVTQDPETMEYEIAIDVDNYLPQEALKSLVQSIVEEIGDETVASDFNENFDRQVQSQAVINSYLDIKFFANGWPSEVISQTKTSLESFSKVNQTYITWDYRSFGNY